MQEKLRLLSSYLENADKALFLDIETEGLSREKNDITLIGIYWQNRYRVFVKGINLSKALNYLQSSPIWVTFGGENFDLPFLKKTFGDLGAPMLHLDLYHFTPLVGLRGGLKKIEKALGLVRKTDGMNGYDAVKLWQKWERERDNSALRRLILYNREDVVNLKIILHYIISNYFKFEVDCYELKSKIF